MKRLFTLLLCLVLLFVKGWSQTITAAEYFIDTDPGVGKANTIAVANPGDAVNLTASIPINTLPSGFHFLAVRAKGSDGVWGLYESRGFYVTRTTSDASAISSAEYFLDKDPGIGKGTALNVGTSGGVVNFTANIPQSLSPGFHFLAIRTKGADGVWGLFETRGFYITNSSSDVSNISSAEYFLDNDPGIGKATALNSGVSGGVVNFTTTIPQNLSPGFHFVAIRAKGADGVWGLFETRGFYVTKETSDAASISSAEYFLDNDPGLGKGTTLNVGASGGVVNFTATIPQNLSPGFHFLAIRTKGADGMWGLFESRGFYVTKETSDAANITSAEYFLDNDPGLGKGTTLNVGASGGVVNFTATLPQTLAPGFHYVAIRTKGSDGMWGLFETRGFYVTESVTDAGDITALEYFYDTDPGEGKGTPVPIDPAVAQYKDTLVFPLGSLPLGNHKIGIRVKDSRGKWSLVESKVIKVCTKDGPLSKMTYFTEGSKIFFTNQSTNADSTIWKFGDNTTDTVVNPVKNYGRAGNYNLELISKNLCGSDTLREVIRINGIVSANAPRSGNAGVATLIITGNGFTPNTPILLRKGTQQILPAGKQFVASDRFIGYFDLTGAEEGFYDVVANLGGGSFDTLKNGFQVVPSVYPYVSLIQGGRNPARFGQMTLADHLQNTGNEDAIMVPFGTVVGYRPGTLNMITQEPMANLSNIGVFKSAYSYLTANGISTDVMSEKDIDTSRKVQLLAYYRVRIPSESYVRNYSRVTNSFGLLAYDNRSVVYPPMYKSSIVLGNMNADNTRDCMNSFLKRAVKKNLRTVTINDGAWDACFNTAFDTLSKTVRDVVKDLSLQQQSIPMKAVYTSLLSEIARCGSTGLPASFTSGQFERIIKDVTYNWLFLENLDSIGRPCFDTTETYVFRKINPSVSGRVNPAGRISAIQTTNCPGAGKFPELAELCKDFADPCKAAADALFEDDNLKNKIGRYVFKKFTKMLGPQGSKGFCGVNSATAGCRALCEQASVDPNIKIGPGDNNQLKHVNYLGDHGYAILFENLPSATAPAAFAEITDTIDMGKFDISTFQLTGFGWGDSIVRIDANRTNYSLLKDLRPTLPNLLRVDVRLDTLKGIATWKFSTLDTMTYELTDDPALGFLPPNTDGKKGSGFVSFTIQPKNGVVSGTVLTNKASIVFDANAPIITPVWQHIIDTLRPQSRVASLPPVVTSTRFEVKWSGSDAHAGIDQYAVYVSDNDGLFQKWKNYSSAVSDTFVGQPNHTYKFFSVATDRAGNFEFAPPDPTAVPDAVTRVEFATNVVDLPEDGLLVYPTVTTGKVMVHAPKPLQVEVLGINGQRMDQLVLRQTGQIDLSGKPAGVYILRLLPLNRVIKVVKY